MTNRIFTIWHATVVFFVPLGAPVGALFMTITLASFFAPEHRDALYAICIGLALLLGSRTIARAELIAHEKREVERETQVVETVIRNLKVDGESWDSVVRMLREKDEKLENRVKTIETGFGEVKTKVEDIDRRVVQIEKVFITGKRA